MGLDSSLFLFTYLILLSTKYLTFILPLSTKADFYIEIDKDKLLLLIRLFLQLSLKFPKFLHF
jgi:hypothetical protein